MPREKIEKAALYDQEGTLIRDLQVVEDPFEEGRYHVGTLEGDGIPEGEIWVMLSSGNMMLLEQ